jgi:alpha-galactosidase
MPLRILSVILIFVGLVGSRAALAVAPTAAELAEARAWAAARWEGAAPARAAAAGQTAGPWFSFTYGGRPSAELLKTWKLTRARRTLDNQRTEHTLTWTDPQTGLVLRCVGVEYRDFPVVEWTFFCKNTSAQATPILADLQALDVQLSRPARGGRLEEREFLLHHYIGGEFSAEAYRPLKTWLLPGTQTQFAGTGGRPTGKSMSYFNLQRPGNAGGLIVAVGWPGQWAAEFACDRKNHLQIRAGQELTHFKLLPGEEIRTPLMVLLFWQGDRLRAHNLWRAWMVAHNVPRPGGRLPPPLLTASSSGQFNCMVRADAACQKLFIDRYLEEGIRLDYWWMDAGWYPCDPVGWPKTGTWEVDTRRFPNGLREVSDHAHAKGLKTLLWFEPERVYRDTWLTKNHPDWILGGEKGGILNLGHPAAWNWLVNHVDRLLIAQGIDLYRQDFNTEPLKNWRANDAEDRQGITENKHVVGYLAFWDELRRRHPGMLIDCCASGGYRNDLETLRRGVPFTRSDYKQSATSQQCHTHGIAFWIPYYGTTTHADGGGLDGFSPYRIRSMMCLNFGPRFDMRRKPMDESMDYPELRRLIDQWRTLAPNYYGDYYPLTSYSLEEDAWMAWQFDRPDVGQGMVQVFRRAESPFETARFKLHGLDPKATYRLTNLDQPGSRQATGQELLEQGLPVTLSRRPLSAIITYCKQP